MHRTCVSHLHGAIISAMLSPPVLWVGTNTPLKIQQQTTLFIGSGPFPALPRALEAAKSEPVPRDGKGRGGEAPRQWELF